MTPENAYIGWIRRVAAVCQEHDLVLENFAQGDWRFNWHQSWVSGITPREAYSDAYCEMLGRGLVDENGDVTPVQGRESI